MAAYVRLTGTPYYIGAASDTKPASCPSGSRCYEHDTETWYITYDGGTNWPAMATQVVQGTAANLNARVEHTMEDVSIYLVGADLTTTGVAYSDEKETVAANTDVVIYGYTFEPESIGGPIIWIYFNVVATLKAESATADLKMTMQIRDKDGTWQDLFSQVTYTDINTTYLDKRYEGYLVKGAAAYCTPGDADLWTYLTEVPFDFQVLLQSNETAVANGRGYGKIKNSSLIRVAYGR